MYEVWRISHFNSLFLNYISQITFFRRNEQLNISHLEVRKIYKTNMKQNHITKQISEQPNEWYNVQLPTPSGRIRKICSMPLF